MRFIMNNGAYDGTESRKVPLGATVARIEFERATRRTAIVPNSLSSIVAMPTGRLSGRERPDGVAQVLVRWRAVTIAFLGRL